MSAAASILAPDTADAASLVWTPRRAPLKPVAVIAEGYVLAAALLKRVLEHSDTALGSWAGLVSPPDTVALLASGPDSDPLPWVDGVRYFGRDPDAAPGLLFPTSLQPAVPAALLHRALRLQYPSVQEPVAVWPRHRAPGAGDVAGLNVLSLADARTLDRAAVEEARRGLLAADARARRLSRETA